MLTQEENEMLTRVGGGTPMGEMLRRYWVPACMSEELPAADCDPIRLRLLCEDLVAFRDTAGRVGIMEESCPHRGASLYFGRNEEGGLRCLYHGWKMDCDGKVLDMPCEPAGSTFKDRVRQLAYPTHEQGGMVWAYMGPVDLMPSFPDFEWTLVPDGNRSIAKVRTEANFVQGIEGTVDSSHGDVLHSGLDKILNQRGNFSNDTVPRFEIRDTDYGFVYAALRDPTEDADRLNYARTTNFVLPFHCLVPPRGFGHMHIFVPIDDEHTWDYSIYFSPTRSIDHQRTLERRSSVPGVDLFPDRGKIRTVENRFLQDRVAMRERRSFTGIPGNTMEDMAVQESMGPIYDRSKEHLGAADAAVIRMRNIMLASARSCARGDDPIGLGASIRFEEIRSHHKMLPKEHPWWEIGSYEGEDLIAAYAGAGVPAD
ncbi:MAG: aromatic ring-hydroxylating dioxygenase subunit alpha [Chloroflexi bacterium]|nr:aromatic ring-hydroxylating dioxygenase subunit alpha [Chloroflexota bacterium]